MSKELEALKELEIGVHDEWDGTSWIEDKLRPIKILEKALTPPTAEERTNFKEWLEFNINKAGYTKEDMEFVIVFLMQTIPCGYAKYNSETFSELSKDLQELKGEEND